MLLPIVRCYVAFLCLGAPLRRVKSPARPIVKWSLPTAGLLFTLYGKKFMSCPKVRCTQIQERFIALGQCLRLATPRCTETLATPRCTYKKVLASVDFFPIWIQCFCFFHVGYVAQTISPLHYMRLVPTRTNWARQMFIYFFKSMDRHAQP